MNKNQINLFVSPDKKYLQKVKFHKNTASHPSLGFNRKIVSSCCQNWTQL